MLFFGVLFGEGRLLCFMYMLVSIACGYACRYVSALFCVDACMLVYAGCVCMLGWVRGLLLGRDVL